MRFLNASLIFCALSVPFSLTNVHAAIDVDAAAVKLRTSCQEAGTTLDNCFTTMNSLTSWISNTRNPKPSASSPLVVDIGPGTFGNIGLSCGGSWGYTSFIGSGRKLTAIGTAPGGYSLNLLNCTFMHFQDMTIGPLPGGFGGINWQGTGTSTWQNIEMITAQTYGWQDVTWNCPSNTRGSHYWFNSRLINTSNQGTARPYISRCSEDWFFGSEILVKPTVNVVYDAFALNAISDRSEIHFYGGVIRAISEAGVTVPDYSTSGSFLHGMGIAHAEAGANIHIHGTGLDILSTEGNSPVALTVESDGIIHANETAYNVSVGTGGSFTRLVNEGGQIHAPYLWEHIPNLPGFESVTGADMSTVINSQDNHPHVVIYDASCQNDWFDSTANACM